MSKDTKIMIAKCNILDAELGLSISRGAFVEAPEDFFTKYGKSFMAPTAKTPFNPKKNWRLVINNWEKIREFFATPQPDGAKTPKLAKSISDIERPVKGTFTPVDDKTPKKRPGMGGTDGAVAGAKEGKTAEVTAPVTTTDTPAKVEPKVEKKAAPKKAAPKKKKARKAKVR